MRRVVLALTAVLAVLGAAFLAGPRAHLDPTRVVAPEIPADLDAYLADREGRVADLRPDAEATIVWADPSTRARTAVSVVYLHGFSADRQEIAPVPQRIATSMGANLFLTRLRGHGRTSVGSMAEARGEQWLEDGLEAIAIAEALGDTVVVVATSNGATLALWLAAEGAPDRIDRLVLLSPNVHPADPSSAMLLWPWGGALAELAIGPERSWTPVNAGHDAHWSHRYPTRALLPMMALVDLVGRTDLRAITVPVLMFRDPEDTVIDGQAAAHAMTKIQGPVTAHLIASDDPDHHVIAGDILSPRTTDEIVQRTVDWLQQTPQAP